MDELYWVTWSLGTLGTLPRGTPNLTVKHHVSPSSGFHMYFGTPLLSPRVRPSLLPGMHGGAPLSIAIGLEYCHFKGPTVVGGASICLCVWLQTMDITSHIASVR